MKRFFIILFVTVSVLFCLSSCGTTSIYEMEKDAEIEAKEERYREGISEAQEYIANRVSDDFWSLEYDLEDRYGISPEDAIHLLTNYVDGEYVSETDLNQAIWVISKYYSHSYEIIYEIDDYWID